MGDANCKVIPGFAGSGGQETIGDEIERVVTWEKGSDVSSPW